MVWACGNCGAETEEDELDYVPENSASSVFKRCGGKTDPEQIKPLLDEDTGAVPDAMDQCDVEVGSLHDGTVTVVTGSTTLELSKINEDVELSPSAVGDELTSGSREIREGPEEETAGDDTTVFSENTNVLKATHSVKRAVAKYMKKIKGSTQRRRKTKQLEDQPLEVSDEGTVGTFDDMTVDTNVLVEALLDARERKTKPKADKKEEPEARTTSEAAIETPFESAFEPADEPAEEAVVEPEEEKREELIESTLRSSQDLGGAVAESIGTEEKSAEMDVPKSSSFQDLSIKLSTSTDYAGIALSRLSDLMNYRNMVQKALQKDLRPNLSADSTGGSREQHEDNIDCIAHEVTNDTALELRA